MPWQPGHIKRFTTLAVFTLAYMGCGSETPEGAPPTDSTGLTPIAGLSPVEQRAFQAGLREFMEIDDAAEGLGPLFNGNSCAQCHNLPRPGGTGLSSVVRAMCPDASGVAQEPPGGSLIPLFSTRPDVARATIPVGCTLVERRRTTSVLGAGLIEAIPDQAIVAQWQTGATAGRVAWIEEEDVRRVGRFGWKAQHATLRVFAGDAYRNEMGITNEVFPTENAPLGDAKLLALMDWTTDPEARVGVVDALADFMRFIAPPSAANAATDPDGAGARTFDSIGCASCHRASYRTGTTPNVSPALADRDVFLYSDLLLHDVGTGSVVAQGAALAGELRTPPLWHLGAQSLLLHDGRATSIGDAIRAHAGEATATRQAFDALTDDDRARLLQFLRGL